MANIRIGTKTNGCSRISAQTPEAVTRSLNLAIPEHVVAHHPYSCLEYIRGKRRFVGSLAVVGVKAVFGLGDLTLEGRKDVADNDFV